VVLIRSLSAALLSVALLAGNVADCLGAATAAARMACCVENDSCPSHQSASPAGHHSAPMNQSDADRCCVSSGRDRSAPSAAALAFVSPLALVVSPVRFVVPEPPAHITARQSRIPSPRVDVPTHVLHSVFLV